MVGRTQKGLRIVSNQNNGSGVWTVIIAMFVIAALISTLTGGGSTSSTAPTTYSPNAGSFEHRYVKERVKLEGYSDREASQAADAIIKFHNVQKNR